MFRGCGYRHYRVQASGFVFVSYCVWTLGFGVGLEALRQLRVEFQPETLRVGFRLWGFRV